MASFRNITAFVLAAGLGLSGMSSAAERAKDPVPASVPAVEAKKADAGKDKRLDLPVPKGQPQKGLTIPIYSPDGKLMMRFQIGVAEVVDADNIKMGDLRLETFKDTGEREFEIELPDSIFNAKTKEVVSNVHVLVKRHDFEITGKSVTFNTETRTGKFGGGVKMVIYDARAAAEEDDKKTEIPTVEVKPVKEEKK
jgi:hypothetical protein